MVFESRTPNPESRLMAFANAALRFILAPACASCQSMLTQPLDGPVCAACWKAIRPITPPICDSCGDPLPSWRVESGSTQQCAQCRHSPRAIDRGRAIGEYDGTLRHIVHAFKYDKHRSLARPLASLMRSYGCDLFDGVDYVVPVPLHRRRERMRGFNQAGDLAQYLNLPVYRGLQRVRETLPQVELAAAARHANVRGAFEMVPPHRWGVRWRRRPPHLSNACVLLVDDVSTTGATLDACALVLKKAGVAEVRALTAARAVRSQLWPQPRRHASDSALRR